MRFSEILSMAFSNLWRRKLRTVLTIAAVVIGATLIALMASLGDGLKGFIVGQFGQTFPEDAVIVSSGRDINVFRGNGGPQEITSVNTVVQPFTAEDISKIKSIPGVERVDYLVSVQARYVQPEDSARMYTVDVSGAPAYEAAIRPLFLGSTISDGDTGKCLISYDYLTAFGWSVDQSVIGRKVIVSVGKQLAYNTDTRDFTFTIQGVIDKKVSSAQLLITQTDAIEMARYYQDNPLRYSEQQPGFTVQVKAENASRVGTIAAAVKSLGFNALTADDILAEINRVFSVIQVGLSAFGIIALVVAAIGIINTLLMAIHERTREIGVMKAVGATRSNIRALFTTEGAALGFLGGGIGVILALVLGQLLNVIGAQTFLSNFPGFKLSVFSFWLVPGVIALTTAISLLAGLYPASRAARLDPVEALRYE
ncbi:ABC transport system permease [Dehalogenimonas formicexedens]|uniref:ABC transport system permease n=1 Tax=Dehalogenimonas formicexedens TaxID=1839801 RepID=A0A1P8F5X9_9CHLR|nr:FtsX-like permease family protein [Dehalogenimonas formicexedens]APV43889.1 ABC transport system permease [Dehalogenimonas formicexedens]